MKRVMVVDQEKEIVDRLAGLLAPDKYAIQYVEDVDAALRRLRAWKPYLIFLGTNLLPKTPQGEVSFEVVSKFRVFSSDDYVCVTLVGESLPLDTLQRAFEAGMDDFVPRDFKPQDLVGSVQSMLRLKDAKDALRRANYRIEELSSTDDLTGLMNMRAAFKRGEEELVRCRRSGKAISTCLLNLDAFYAVNQTYGFMAGSQILQEIANRIKQCVRSNDVVARIGGDEFFLLLPEVDLPEATAVAERIRDSIQSVPFKSDKHSIKLTAALGVAGLTPNQTHQKMSDLLHITSEALMSAKADGPNHVEVYSLS